MKTITYQTKYFGMMRNVLIALFLTSTFVFSQVFEIQVSDNNSYGLDGLGAYNEPASIYDQSATVKGGINIVGTGIDRSYSVAIAYHPTGTNADEDDIWIDVPNLSGIDFMLYIGNTISDLVSHTTISGMSNYPGDDWTGQISVAIHTYGANAGWDPSAYLKVRFAFDLDVPEVENAVISVAKTAPFNQAYPH